MQIHEAQHGINIVVETGDVVYIGRFDHTDGFRAVMRDCAVHPIRDSAEAETFIRTTAKYGIAVEQREVVFEVGSVKRVRVLGQIPQQ